MTQPKQQVDVLITGGIVLTMDPDWQQFEPGAVAVQGDRIVAVGPADALAAQYTANDVVDATGKVVMPGLVNAHTHVPMTLLRGLADDLRLDVWLLGYMMPVEREFVSPEFVRLGTLLAAAELIRSGVTTFADMYYFEDEVARATAEAGLRAVASQTVLKFPAPDAKSYEEALEYAEDFIRRWKGHPLIVPAIAPHAPYTTTPEILRTAAKIAATYDVPLHIHLAETALEVENMRREHNMPVIPYVKKQGLFEAKVIAAHCVHIDEGEMYTLKHHHAGVAHNPSSNLKLASGIAPVQQMLRVGLNVGIGTDGPASNNDLDMFEEVRLTALLAKGATGDPTAVPATTALLMATRMGAAALHLDHITGSLEPGKRADIILVDITPVHNQPRFRRDPKGVYAQIVYAAKSTDVTDVMVNGRWLMRNRALLTVAEEEFIAQAQDLARRIDAFLIQRERSVLSKLIAIEQATEQESYEVQVKVPITPEQAEEIVRVLHTHPEIDILYTRHYRQYDTYFFFRDGEEALRYREDEFIGPDGRVERVRYRLTLIGPSHERAFDGAILLSRSRYLAQASHSLRFYREYFQPQREVEVVKDRRRWKIRYRDTEFFVNLDQVEKPIQGNFVEIKSRTWSARDAERKAALISELLQGFGLDPNRAVKAEYTDMASL
ncbi:MAG: amidohydrolase [Chloroflexi bacterium]|nr:amidohydrolase [Chloroflexota bacterium]